MAITTRFDAAIDRRMGELSGEAIKLQSARDPITHAARCGRFEGLMEAKEIIRQVTKQRDTEDNDR